MTRVRFLSPVPLAVLVAIGCGSGLPAPSEARQAGKPQDAAAKTDSNTLSSAPIRLAQAPAESQPAAGTASITGSAKLDGVAPKAEPVKMAADPVCQQQHSTRFYPEDVVADGQGMLKNVFVYVKQGVSGAVPAPTAPVVLGQTGCWYQPHVFGIQVGQPLQIVNNDATLHNVNAKPTVNQPFNVAQPVKGMKTSRTFTKPEVMVHFKCNVHPWMSAYAGVVEHPFFAVTDEHGSFSIQGLPAGTYVVEAWQEKCGTQTQTVTVGSGETKSVAFTFNAQ